MKLLSVITICLLLFITCKQSDIVYPEGGYNYPTNVSDKDTTFYSYPLKDLSPPFDSMQNFETYFLLRLFDEPNLSLKPQKTTVFRFTYIGWGYSTIINLTPSEIIVKKQTKFRYPLFDKEKLNEKEKEDFGYFEFLAEYAIDSFQKKLYQHLADSLISLKPYLLDINYYRELQNKSTDARDVRLEYSVKRIPIAVETFSKLIALINKSGYWQMSHEHICGDISSDASTYILEANTPTKYKFVRTIECPGDNSKYAKACQELMKYATTDDDIHLIQSGAATTEEPVKIRELKLMETKEEKSKVEKKKDK